MHAAEAQLTVQHRFRIAKAQSRRLLAKKQPFDESEHPRDEQGKWTDGGVDATAPKEYPQNIGESIAELEKDAPKFFGDRTFTDDEIKAVNNYIRFLKPEFDGKKDNKTGYEAINSNLRKNASYHTAEIGHLDAAIEKGIAPHDMKVYRGIGSALAKQIAGQWDERGSISFKDNAFVSTSVSKKKATGFSKDMMEIRIGKGRQALPIAWNGEGEIILERGSKFKVTNVKKTAAGYRRITAELI